MGELRDPFITTKHKTRGTTKVKIEAMQTNPIQRKIFLHLTLCLLYFLIEITLSVFHSKNKILNKNGTR